MKHIIALLAISLAACGGGSVYVEEEVSPKPVQPIPVIEPVCGNPGEVVVGPTPACKLE